LEEEDLADHQKRGQKLGAIIGFLDESGISLRPTVRRTWAPKGQTPIIESGAVRWERRSVIGVITCTPKAQKPKLYLRIFKEKIGSKEIIQYLKELKRHIKGRLILLWDRLPAHRSKEMQEFLKYQKKWLSIEYFPAYAPELNPLEYLYSTGKQKDLANLYADILSEIDKAIRRYKYRLRKRPDLLIGFLKASSLFDKELSS